MARQRERLELVILFIDELQYVPTRAQLIAKGIIWSPAHRDTAFTVPLFDEFMRRIMANDGYALAE